MAKRYNMGLLREAPSTEALAEAYDNSTFFREYMKKHLTTVLEQLILTSEKEETQKDHHILVNLHGQRKALRDVLSLLGDGQD